MAKIKKSNLLLYVFCFLLILVVGHYFVDLIRRKPPKGMVLMEQASADSLKAYIKMADSLKILAHSQPDVIIIWDTVYLDTLYITHTEPIILSNPDDENLKTVTDSLNVEGQISAWIEFQVKGKLVTGIEWKYTPIVTTQTVTVTKNIPYPVIETIEVSKVVTGHYLSFNAGGNDKMFIFGLNYDIARERNIYGLQYQRFGKQNVYGIKAGINLNNIFKRKKNGT
jgi:hypothetical protein